jgi:hypothetical protein
MGKLTAAAIEHELQQQTTAAMIASVRKLVGTGGAIPAGTPVGRLSDNHLGWIACAIITAWISKRAEHASHGDFDLVRTEEAIRYTGWTPEPWDAGAVAAILPNIAEIQGVPWDTPIGAWPKDTIIRFLCAAFDLVRHSMKCRDAGSSITRPAQAFEDAVPL